MEKKGLSLTLTKAPARIIANKRTMNFAYRESIINWKKVGIVTGILALVIIVFAKFAVVDQLQRKYEAQEARDAAQRNLARATSSMASYKQLKAEYDTYTDARMNEDERFLVDRVEIFDIIRNDIMPYCSVESVSLRGNNLTMGISGISLSQLSNLITHLYENELVIKVEPRSAYSTDGNIASHSIIITVQKEGVVVEEA